MKLNEHSEPKARVFADHDKPVEGKSTKAMSKMARRATKAKYAAKKEKK